MNESIKEKLSLYYKEISDNALCTKKQKAAFLKELKKEIGDYVENSPTADMEEITAVFGSPSEIAQGFSESIPQSEIRKRLSLKKAVIAFLLVFLIIWAVFAVISLIDVHTEAHGYFKEELLFIYNVWEVML